MKFVDNYLDKITIYRLMLYFLLILSIFGLFLQPPINYILSLVFVVVVGWTTNKIFSLIFKSPTNLESVYISALILALVIPPDNFVYLSFAAVITNASKYIFAINKKHIFNPVAAALVITGYASWWIASIYTLPIILLGGLLITRKLRRSKMVFSFILVSIIAILLNGNSLKGFITSYPLFFFAFVMLTEPLTAPTAKIWQIVYGILVGILFSLRGVSPEMALIIGNIFAYLVSSKEKLILTLKDKVQIAPDIYEFIFKSRTKLNFQAGQYLEWTIPVQKSDSRGNRRYMTIASSPTEADIRMATKYYEEPSSFKKTLITLNTPIVASQLAGDFVLPKDPSIKLVFVAGGIGITPYRSMIKYLIDTKQTRDINLIYINKTANEAVYKDVLDYVKTIYINTSVTGHLDADTIVKNIFDYQSRAWYISGPHNMVTATEELLKSMGIKNLKTDFFPGLV